MSEIIEKAKSKLSEELKNFRGEQKEKAVSSHVAKTLKEFCKNEIFAAAVVNSKKTMSDCCADIMKGCGSSISDFEVYRKAAKFYFPGAKVEFSISIDTGDGIVTVEDAATIDKPKPTKKTKKTASSLIQISLFEEAVE